MASFPFHHALFANVFGVPYNLDAIHFHKFMFNEVESEW